MRYLLYTNFKANWTIFPGLVGFSVDVYFFNWHAWISAKMTVFLTKNGHFSADFAEILGIDKNHQNTSYVKILGYLGHFLAKYGHFCSFLAHFYHILPNFSKYTFFFKTAKKCKRPKFKKNVKHFFHVFFAVEFENKVHLLPKLV